MDARKLFQKIYRQVDGHECTFDVKKDNDFLNSLSLKRITPFRQTCSKEETQTELDRLLAKEGRTGCNESAMVDFVCECDGLQVIIFEYCGIWSIGDSAAYNGQLISIKD